MAFLKLKNITEYVKALIYNKVIALSEFDIGVICDLGIEFKINFKPNIDI